MDNMWENNIFSLTLPNLVDRKQNQDFLINIKDSVQSSERLHVSWIRFDSNSNVISTNNVRLSGVICKAGH